MYFTRLLTRTYNESTCNSNDHLRTDDIDPFVLITIISLADQSLCSVEIKILIGHVTITTPLSGTT